MSRVSDTPSSKGLVGRRTVIATSLGAVLAAATSSVATSSLVPHADGATQTLFFDDFNGPAGAAPNPRHWTHHLGSTGYSPSAIYVNDRRNSFIDGDSHLVLRATPVIRAPKWWPSALYQSPWLHTRGKFSAGFNTTWEARIKFNPQPGIWPAFWTMGSRGEWPDCGEVDIVEVFGRKLSGSTVHTPIPLIRRTNQSVKQYQVDNQWHTWRMTWDAQGFCFWKDHQPGSKPFFRVANGSLPLWPFNYGNPLFALLTVTVGGPRTEAWESDPRRTKLPNDTLVDWVRVTRAAGA